MGESIGVLALARMIARHPEVRMRLATSNCAEIPRAILEREASVGLLALQDLNEDPNLHVERLRPQPGVFLVRRGHRLSRRRGIGLADILAHPLAFIGRVPREVQGPMAEARHAARHAGDVHAAYPALVIESPTLSIAALPHSDAVIGVPVPIAMRTMRGGDVVALRWREPWLALRPGILTRRGERLDEVERDFLSQLRVADAEEAEKSIAWCRRNGIDPRT